MKIIICDDNQEFSAMLSDEVKKILHSNERYSMLDIECRCIYPASKVIEYADTEHIDILFLDINMPDTNGFETAERFYNEHKDTYIIFVSDIENYVFYAIRFNPFRFIRKPNLSNELTEALTSALDEILISDRQIEVCNRDECVSLNISRIVYIEKEKRGNYLNIRSIDGNYRHRCNLVHIAEELSDAYFVKINSGTIINMKHIMTIRQEGTVLMSDNSVLTVSRKYLPELTSSYIKYMRNKKGGVR
ncbi:MAG: response regulator transcription factor [Clostridia bacterium]|nr:response regulator transcription factor [Clostridia bacterium]MBQ4601854.1 response regulator transcription factor [Clostridia bacterium]